MKFVSFLNNKNERLGLFNDDKIYDLKDTAARLNLSLPDNMNEFLRGGEKSMSIAFKVDESVKKGSVEETFNRSSIQLIAPVPHPASCRDGYAFRQHVATARRNRGVEMIPEFDQFPVFYFTNHNGIIGEGIVEVEKDHLEKLDFELEAAIVLNKEGINISAGVADSYIAGYMIMNDLSARRLQMEEMKLNLGPMKGKDFATAIGPWLVTPDELEEFKIITQHGFKFDLEMKAFHNGKQVSSGNMKDMNWTFAEIIERASYGVKLFPGDVIGSGTVGTGCYLELNGTWAIEAKEKGESFTPVWLQDGDTIACEIKGLGVLENKIAKKKSDYSILAKKKKV
ncbi:MAG TPA: fumarylacetoacetate hydrolase family protein [Ignavibacteriaceae bacterium]|nr:fumarylacetoacetate hydrolase family protein [Ignavibacteriaceae bacterium]